MLVAIVVTALFVLPGMALGKRGGGNGTPNPPPSNPPCNSDNHLIDPLFQAKHKQCNSNSGGTSTGKDDTKGDTGKCDKEDTNRAKDKCETTDGDDNNGTSTTNPTTTTTTTTTTTSPTTTSEDPCETDGLLGSNGVLKVGGPDETIGDLLVDGGLPLHEPEVPPGGPLTGPLYNAVAPLVPGVTPPVAAEVTCALNLLNL